MINKEKTLCFTGHREIRNKDADLYSNLYKILENLISQGFVYFGTGGARGFDTFAAEVVIKLKEKYRNIYLILVLPFMNQYKHEKDWSIQEIEQYYRIKEKSSKVVYIQKSYSLGCYYRRNRHLVDFSSICICYQYKNFGGTAYTTKYAREKGLKIINCIKN